MAKKDDKYSMPMSGAGLVRYFDDESVGPKVSPEIIIAITVILGIFCLILRYSV
ncbi:preprotein translocase subunit Sec61beta [uncultured Methanobrevibacter sp.]|uniref:preprotein translocase subunit Sec61beta n=1 Tax=uncultured Methanobrevibacter sp. TaxID=253161 RepID=UPI0026262C5B